MIKTSNENTIFLISSPYTPNRISDYKILVLVFMELGKN